MKNESTDDLIGEKKPPMKEKLKPFMFPEFNFDIYEVFPGCFAHPAIAFEELKNSPIKKKGLIRKALKFKVRPHLRGKETSAPTRNRILAGEIVFLEEPFLSNMRDACISLNLSDQLEFSGVFDYFKKLWHYSRQPDCHNFLPDPRYILIQEKVNNYVTYFNGYFEGKFGQF